MKLFRCRTPLPDPEPPRGIVLHVRGRAIPCTPLREPDADERGCAAWLAVPAESVRILPGEKFALTAGELPDGCVLYPGFSWEMDGATDAWL